MTRAHPMFRAVRLLRHRLRAARRAGLVLAVALALVSPSAAADVPWLAQGERARVFEALVDVFEHHYWNPEHLDWNAWADAYRSEAIAAPTRAAFDATLARMVAAVGDDHSVWMGVASGSGVEGVRSVPDRLGVRTAYVPGEGLVVEHAYAKGPLRVAGVRRGDVIVAVDGVALTALDPEPARERLERSAWRGSTVLDVRRGRTSFRAELVAADRDVSGLAELPDGWMLDDRTGYLYVPSFRLDDVGMRVHRVLEGLIAEGASRLVLDLRGNSGGRLSQLGLVLGAFVEGPWAEAFGRGRVVWTGTYAREADRGVARLMGSRGALVAAAVDAPTSFGGPLVVLVDAATASAGEVAAMALQDVGRAAVVGVPTGGNVEAVQTFDLPHGHHAMVAVANMRGISGTPFTAGVRPDEIAWSTASGLARGFDAAVGMALRRLGGLGFTPGKYF